MPRPVRPVVPPLLLLLAACLVVAGSLTAADSPVPVPLSPLSDQPKVMDKWPQPIAVSPATTSKECGACHVAIYREYAYGLGSDLQYNRMVYKSPQGKALTMPATVSGHPTAHAFAGRDPFPAHARDAEAGGQSCNACHFPASFTIPDLMLIEAGRPEPRPAGQEAEGVSCVSCHLAPDGRIRVADDVNAPHPTVFDSRLRTSVMCAYCHAKGRRAPGKQTNTFFEWRDDYHLPLLGSQECQDCHMPRTIRQAAEGYPSPNRVVGRHLWTGGHSAKRVAGALEASVAQPDAKSSALEFHVINVGAGHSAPTGSNRRAVFLRAAIMDRLGKTVAEHEWMFAPNYGDRPDDKAFLDRDKELPDAPSAMQADAQGPHEPPVRAGEDRILSWDPKLGPGSYLIRAILIYDLNRYNAPSFMGDRTVFQNLSMQIVPGE